MIYKFYHTVEMSIDINIYEKYAAVTMFRAKNSLKRDSNPF